MAKNRVMELKQELQLQKKEELKQKHINEKVEIEKAHLNSKMQEFDEKAKEVEEETLKR